jgi:hypothetical protein
MTNSEAAEKVLSGYKMPKPEECPSEIYSLMVQCWEAKPTNRPSFTYIVEQFGVINKELAVTVKIEESTIPNRVISFILYKNNCLLDYDDYENLNAPNTVDVAKGTTCNTS